MTTRTSDSRKDEQDRSVRLSLNLLGMPVIAGDCDTLTLSSGSTRLCAYLILGPRGGCSRSVVAAQLYADAPESTARRRLNTAVWRLNAVTRAAFGTHLVVPTRGKRMIAMSQSSNIVVDVWLISDLVGQVVQSTRPSALSRSDVDRLEQAIGYYRGPLAPTVDDDWILGPRTRIDHLFLTAVGHLVHHYGVLGDAAGVTRCGELALEVDPTREDIHRAMMTAYAAAGRMDLADAQFERCRSTLLQVLDTAPMPQTIDAYRQLRTHVDEPREAARQIVGELLQVRRDLARLRSDLDKALTHARDLT